MATLYGKEVTKSDLMKRIGDVSQVAGAKQYVMKSGRADGVSAVDVKTGSGFNFTVLPSRGMDLAWAEYKGIPLAFISKSGISSPAYFEEPGLGFLRNFTCGLVTTCGLTYMGSPCVDEGQPLGLHGRISNIPADDVSVTNEWVGDEFVIKVRGKVRQSGIFLENLVLTREITTKLGDKRIYISDTIENCGYDRQPFMLLYHLNFGYPIVSKDTVLIESKVSVKSRDAEAEKGINEYNIFQDPTHGYAEQVFYHDIEAGPDGMTYACLFNKSMGSEGMGAYVKFSREQFSHFGEWKLMGEGDYVVGLEPSTWYPEGRAEARKRGELKYIEPGETKRFDLEIGVVEGSDELNNL